MIEIKAIRIDMYRVELLGQIHMMSEADYIKFLENLDELPRPEAMNQEKEADPYEHITGDAIAAVVEVWERLKSTTKEVIEAFNEASLKVYPVEEWEPDYTKEVKAPKTLRDIAREHSVPMDVVSEIAQMPPYDSARTFKDSVCVRESMNTKYKIESLKAVYRDTHHNVRW